MMTLLYAILGAMVITIHLIVSYNSIRVAYISCVRGQEPPSTLYFLAGYLSIITVLLVRGLYFVN